MKKMNTVGALTLLFGVFCITRFISSKYALIGSGNYEFDTCGKLYPSDEGSSCASLLSLINNCGFSEIAANEIRSVCLVKDYESPGSQLFSSVLFGVGLASSVAGMLLILIAAWTETSDAAKSSDPVGFTDCDRYDASMKVTG